MRHINLLFILAFASLGTMAQNIENGILMLNEIKKIENSAFYERNDFTKVHFSSELIEIENYAFQKSALTEVQIPASTKKIGERAFADCSDLIKVVIEDGVEEIGTYAFYNYSKHFEITIPSSVHKFGNAILGVGIAHVIEGSDAHKYMQENGYNYDFYGVYSETEYACLNVESLTKKTFAECKKLKQIDIPKWTTQIEENAIPENVMIRCYRNSYADNWAKEHGYVLCGVLADLNLYTKDESKKIEENFIRIMCDEEKLNTISKYEFSISEPLQIKYDKDGWYLYSYMLEPVENINIIYKNENNSTVIQSFKNIQPLTKNRINTQVSEKSILSVETNDELYNKIHSLKVDWNVRFSDFNKVNYENDQAAVKSFVCREWISILTKMATVICDDRYKENMKASVGNFYSNYDGEPMNYLDLDSIMSLYNKMFKHDFEIGLLLQEGVLGRAALDGSYIAYCQDILTRTQYLVDCGMANAYFHEYSHNMGYNHEDGNMCNGATEGAYPMVGAHLYVDMLSEGSLPYDKSNLLNTAIFSKDCIYDFEKEEDLNYVDNSFDEEYYISNDTLYIREGVTKIPSNYFTKATGFKTIVFPSTLTKLEYSAFQYSSVESVTIPSNIKVIEGRAFADCPNLKEVIVKDGVIEIGEYAFFNCDISDMQIVLPKSIEKISSSYIACYATFSVYNDSPAMDYVMNYYGNDYLNILPNEEIQIIELKRGWNLISINIDIDDRSISSIFKNIDVEQIKTENLFWNKWQAEQYNKLSKLNSGEGYIIYVSEDATITLHGRLIENYQRPQLSKGWNLVGSQYNYNVNLMKNFPDYQISAVRDLEKYWDKYNSDFSNFEIQPTKGYYIYVE